MKTLEFSIPILKKSLMGLLYLFVLWAAIFCIVFFINSGIFLYKYLSLQGESYTAVFDDGFFAINGDLVGFGPNFVNWCFLGLLLFGFSYVMRKRKMDSIHINNPEIAKND